MIKNILLLTVVIWSMSLALVSCNDEENTEKEEEIETGTKPSVTTFQFKSNGKDCGLTDGFANQQHTLSHLIHLNTDKCNGESFRPTITLNFEKDKTIVPGTYTIASSDVVAAGEFKIESVQYNYTSWDGTAGAVVVSTNAEDATKIDIELKSITMTNRTANDPKNPATDTLSGYIIKI